MNRNGIRKAKPLSRQQIRGIADNIRKWENAENELYFDIVHFMDVTLPRIAPEFSMEVVSREELGDAQGLTYPDSGIIKIREDVYEGAVNGKGRDRLTLAHELFHLLQHDDSNITFARGNFAEELRPFEDPEWQADAFGGELLVPHHLVADMSPGQISAACGVSMAAAKVQFRAR